MESVEEEERHELVIALVGAVGTDLPWVEQRLIEALEQLGWQGIPVHLSALMTPFEPGLPTMSAPYDEYVDARMTAGNVLRERTADASTIARLGVAELRKHRAQITGDEDLPARRVAYLLRSLKHPSEVIWLRRVYGPQFLLVGCHTPRGERITDLAGRIAGSRHTTDTQRYRENAERLAIRDEEERDNEYGQNVGTTFPLADFFVDLADRDNARDAITRFVRLILSEPYHSPTKDEYAMFHAVAAAARSADLSRQVGAAIATDRADIVAVGCNEVPRFDGGSYWEGDTGDARDFRRGGDANQHQRDRALDEILDRLVEARWLARARLKTTGTEFRRLLDGTRVDNLTEFGRAVHAEMSAITDAARRGVSIHQATLYTTTFPCHNCAKHIVAAGLRRVVFIAPYPKSLAGELHDDALVIDEPRRGGRVAFEHFSGVAPSLYLPLFQRPGKRKKPDGTPDDFGPADARPRLATVDPLYVEREQAAIRSLPTPREYRRRSAAERQT
jgi:deoxycytidylate deaminase